jgi:hypothetical protein
MSYNPYLIETCADGSDRVLGLHTAALQTAGLLAEYKATAVKINQNSKYQKLDTNQQKVPIPASEKCHIMLENFGEMFKEIPTFGNGTKLTWSKSTWDEWMKEYQEEKKIRQIEEINIEMYREEMTNKECQKFCESAIPHYKEKKNSGEAKQIFKKWWTTKYMTALKFQSDYNFFLVFYQPISLKRAELKNIFQLRAYDELFQYNKTFDIRMFINKLKLNNTLDDLLRIQTAIYFFATLLGMKLTLENIKHCECKRFEFQVQKKLDAQDASAAGNGAAKSDDSEKKYRCIGSAYHFSFTLHSQEHHIIFTVAYVQTMKGCNLYYAGPSQDVANCKNTQSVSWYDALQDACKVAGFEPPEALAEDKATHEYEEEQEKKVAARTPSPEAVDEVASDAARDPSIQPEDAEQGGQDAGAAARRVLSPTPVMPAEDDKGVEAGAAARRVLSPTPVMPAEDDKGVEAGAAARRVPSPTPLMHMVLTKSQRKRMRRKNAQAKAAMSSSEGSVEEQAQPDQFHRPTSVGSAGASFDSGSERSSYDPELLLQGSNNSSNSSDKEESGSNKSDEDGRLQQEPAKNDEDGRLHQEPAENDEDGRLQQEPAENDEDGRLQQEPAENEDLADAAAGIQAEQADDGAGSAAAGIQAEPADDGAGSAAAAEIQAEPADDGDGSAAAAESQEAAVIEASKLLHEVEKAQATIAHPDTENLRACADEKVKTVHELKRQLIHNKIEVIYDFAKNRGQVVDDLWKNQSTDYNEYCDSKTSIDKQVQELKHKFTQVKSIPIDELPEFMRKYTDYAKGIKDLVSLTRDEFNAFHNNVMNIQMQANIFLLINFYAQGLYQCSETLQYIQTLKDTNNKRESIDVYWHEIEVLSNLDHFQNDVASKPLSEQEKRNLYAKIDETTVQTKEALKQATHVKRRFYDCVTSITGKIVDGNSVQEMCDNLCKDVHNTQQQLELNTNRAIVIEQYTWTNNDQVDMLRKSAASAHALIKKDMGDIQRKFSDLVDDYSNIYHLFRTCKRLNTELSHQIHGMSEDQAAEDGIGGGAFVHENESRRPSDELEAAEAQQGPESRADEEVFVASREGSDDEEISPEDAARHARGGGGLSHRPSPVHAAADSTHNGATDNSRSPVPEPAAAGRGRGGFGGFGGFGSFAREQPGGSRGGGGSLKADLD